MLINYGCQFKIYAEQPVPAVCLIDVHPDHAHHVLPGSVSFSTSPDVPVTMMRDGFGNVARRFELPTGEMRFTLSGTYESDGRLDRRNPQARVLSVEHLPSFCLAYLAPSRFVESDLLGEFAWNQFGSLPRDVSLVEAICTFAHERLRFDYGCASATRTALQAHGEGVGVCRDFAHLAIGLCRALNVPARYVNGYMGDIGVPADPAPMDFNAWFEVYLDDGWTTFDARHNCRRIGRIPIARGRDAADIPMLRTFGAHTLRGFEVTTERANLAAAAE